MAIGLISKVNAVNAVISVTGDAPVSSLNGEYEQAVIAERILDKYVLQELAKGFWFNEIEDLEIQPNIDGEIYLPADTISAEAQGDRGELVQRGLRLFSKVLNSYKIEQSVCIHVIQYLAWEDLPQTFRQYVVEKSKEEYNNEYFGSQEVARTVERAVAETYIVLKREDYKMRDVNMLTSIRSSNIAFRNRRG